MSHKQTKMPDEPLYFAVHPNHYVSVGGNADVNPGSLALCTQRELIQSLVPSAYKNIRNVMKAQRDLTHVTRELRPLLNYKGV
jgi:hypothetical protein